VRPLCFVDTETTGLDPDIHQAYEACWWRDDHDDGPTTITLPHDLTHADERALEIGRYHERGFSPGRWIPSRWHDAGLLNLALTGVTLVGSNPSFDAEFLRRLLGDAPWHYRLINIEEGAMWLFGWDRPGGLADVSHELRRRGYEIPFPDHTAEGDVRVTRTVYHALRDERRRLPR